VKVIKNLREKIFKHQFTMDRMGKVNKKGLSPVIATVLLISIALVLAVIIFLWARSFVGEAVSKEKYGRIELACADIKFRAEAFATSPGYAQTIDVVNDGNVPIYGVDIRRKDVGTIESVKKFDSTIGNGKTQSINVSSSSFSVNDELQLTPIIVGTAGETKKTYTCTDYSVDVKVQEAQSS